MMIVEVTVLAALVLKFLPFLVVGASRIVDQGLAQSADNDAGNGAQKTIQSMSISNFGTLLAGTTSLAAATQKASAALDSKVRTGNVVAYKSTFGTSTGTIVVSNITLHRVATGTYTDVHGGVDALSITKDNSYTMIPTLELTYATA